MAKFKIKMVVNGRFKSESLDITIQYPIFLQAEQISADMKVRETQIITAEC